MFILLTDHTYKVAAVTLRSQHFFTNILPFFLSSGMSFCCGSMNCHLSDGKIYQSKSTEIHTGVGGGGGLVVTDTSCFSPRMGCLE